MQEISGAGIYFCKLEPRIPIQQNVTGADIKDIVYYAAVYAMDKDQEQVESKDFEVAYQYVMKRYA